MVCLANEDKSLSAEKLSKLENIPRDYVDQLLFRLRRASLIKSRRGAHGGYALAKTPEKISIGNIITAVQNGSIIDSVCTRYEEGETQCSHTSGCGIRPVWQRITTMVEEFLQRVTLAELTKSEEDAASRVALLFKEVEGKENK